MKVKGIIILMYLFNTFFSFSQTQDSLAWIMKERAKCITKEAAIVFLYNQSNRTEIDGVYEYCIAELRQLLRVRDYPAYKTDRAFAVALGGAYNDVGYEYNYNGQADSAILFYNKGKEVRAFIKDSLGVANIYMNTGYAYQNQARYREALEQYTKAIPIYLSKREYKILAGNYNNIASIYNIQGNVKKAVYNLMLALDYYTRVNDKNGMAWIYNSLGYVYAQQEEWSLARDWYSKGLKLATQSNNKETLALIFNNMGSLETEQRHYDLALSYHLKALKIRRGFRDVRGEVMSLNNIGNLLIITRNYPRAELYLNDGKAKSVASGYVEGLTKCYINLAELNEKCGRFDKAMVFADSAYNLAKQTDNLDQLVDAAKRAYWIEKQNGNTLKALFYLEESTKLQDSIRNREIQKEIYKKQYEYDLERQEQTFLIEKQKKELEVARQKRVRNVFILVLFFALILGTLVTRNLIQSRKKNKIIMHQKEFIEDKQKEIVDSITYAKRLQYAILPNAADIDACFSDNFILYQPKDIVAGDFYWLERVGGMLFFAVADSTGHGVPGAMVSIVCSNALNKSVREFGLTDPGKILDKTRELILETFARSNEQIRDGMDISLVVIDTAKWGPTAFELKWAGANNPLWYISNRQVFELRPDKQSVGSSDLVESFKTHTLCLQKGDSLYLFTDGYADQFGGPHGKKFKYKALKELIIANQDLPMSEQRNHFLAVFTDWKGALEQVDDVTLVGILV